MCRQRQGPLAYGSPNVGASGIQVSSLLSDPSFTPFQLATPSRIMIRAAFLPALRCASRSTLRTQFPAPRAIPSCFSVSSHHTPATRFQGARCYSAPAGLEKVEVEGRIMDLLKNFDKVRPRKMATDDSVITVFVTGQGCIKGIPI